MWCADPGWGAPQRSPSLPLSLPALLRPTEGAMLSRTWRVPRRLPFPVGQAWPRSPAFRVRRRRYTVPQTVARGNSSATATVRHRSPRHMLDSYQPRRPVPGEIVVGHVHRAERDLGPGGEMEMPQHQFDARSTGCHHNAGRRRIADVGGFLPPETNEWGRCW